MAVTRPTKLKILDAAEELFAESGFAETSLRQITQKAEVNLASVNYHFGSKKELIRAVLERYLSVLVPGVSEELSKLKNRSIRQGTQPTLEMLFSVFIKPVLMLNEVRKSGTAIFLQLLGRGYTDSQGHLRWFFVNHYGDVLSTFVEMVHAAHPKLPPSEIFWRLHFTLGTVVFTMASSEALIDIAQADFDEEIAIEGVIKRLVPYIAAGVGADAVIDNEFVTV
jgi:AcrR family transcriptional regulator